MSNLVLVSLSAHNLCIGYGSHTVQRNISFALHAGEMVCLLGPNGCGKSTLLRTLSGMQAALSGTIEPHLDEKNLALVLTENVVLDSTTIHEVVALGRYPYTSFMGGLSAQDEQIISDALCSVGLRTEDMFTPFANHSDGEKQRVLIAKALAQQTPLILLDEPTAHLDLPNRIMVLKLLRDLAHREGKTVLISTHELDLALKLSDRIMLMSDGGVVLDSAASLRAQDAFTNAFHMDIFQ